MEVALYQENWRQQLFPKCLIIRFTNWAKFLKILWERKKTAWPIYFFNTRFKALLKVSTGHFT